MCAHVAHSHPPPTACRLVYHTADHVYASLTSHPHSLPSFLCFLSSLLPPPTPFPQITAVFTRALRDLPTRPRVRSHSPRQAKKNPPKSYQASCLLTHWCVDVMFVCAWRCMLHQPGGRLQFVQHKILLLLPSLTLTLISPCFLDVECHWSPCKTTLLKHTHTYTGLHWTACLYEEPTVFCWSLNFSYSEKH